MIEAFHPGLTLFFLTARGALIHYLTRSAMQPSTPTTTSDFTVSRRRRLAVYKKSVIIILTFEHARQKIKESGSYMDSRRKTWIVPVH
jgi:hypothetical protein